MTSTAREITILVALENLSSEKKLKETLARLAFQKKSSLQNLEGTYQDIRNSRVVVVLVIIDTIPKLGEKKKKKSKYTSLKVRKKEF